MYYQESDSLVGRLSINEEDIAAVDEYLFKNQGAIVRLGRVVDFTNLSPQLVESIMRELTVLQVTLETSVPICPKDDSPMEEPNPYGEYVCDLCDRTYQTEKLSFETVYIPRETAFEDGDRLTSTDGSAVDGVHRVSGCTNSERVADIIFLHGLNGDATTTWHVKGDPKKSFTKWLGEEIANVGVWSIDYDASSSGWTGTTLPLVDRATNLLAKLEAAGIGTKPTIFVVHSLGGLVAKQLLLHSLSYANPAWELIGGNIKGFVFIATPHSGSGISNFVKYLGKLYSSTVTVKELEKHSPALRDINQRFRGIVEKRSIRVEVFFETEPVIFGFTVVDEGSSDPGLPGVVPIPIESDHINICKPESKTDVVFIRTINFIRKLLK
jgi:pimeloyl-ACP methyl ester carboxylesterase